MKQLGSALITALFIMSIVAIAATSMSVNLQSDIYRTRLKINADKNYLAAQGVTFWAMAVLSKTNTKSEQRKDKRLWAFPLKFKQKNLAYPDRNVQGEIVDLQGLYNLNNLQDTQAIPGFLNFLKYALPQSTASQRRQITLAIINWLSKPKPGRNLHDNFYQNQKPPYLSAHLPFAHVSELQLVKGITAKIYQKLYPYLTVLPAQTKLNINAAPKLVLYSISYQTNQRQVEQIIQARGKAGFKDNKDMQQKLEPYKMTIKSVVINSEYFLVKAEAGTKKQQLTTFTTLQRSLNKKGKAKLAIISQRFTIR